MSFLKGHPPYFKKHSEETKRKLSELKKGKPLSEYHRSRLNMEGLKLGPGWNKGLLNTWSKAPITGSGKDNPFFGKKHTIETKEKMRLAKLDKPGNKKGYKLTKDQKIALSNAHKGYKMPEETKRKISLANKGKPKPEGFGLRGKMNPLWKGGKKKERQRLMQQKEYILWRAAIFMRDNYTCQICFIKGGSLEVDHIKPWSLYPELRYAIDNGRTLCVSCHRQTDTWGGRVFKYGYTKN